MNYNSWLLITSGIMIINSNYERNWTLADDVNLEELPLRVHEWSRGTDGLRRTDPRVIVSSTNEPEGEDANVDVNATILGIEREWLWWWEEDECCTGLEGGGGTDNASDSVDRLCKCISAKADVANAMSGIVFIVLGPPK